MYIEDAIPDLVESLARMCGRKTIAYVAHGRNCGAEAGFLQQLGGWSVRRLPASEQHPSFHAPDVTILECRRPT